MNKKKILNILKQNVKNSFSQDEAGQKAAEAIIELLEAMMGDEETQFTLADIEAKIAEAIAAAKPSEEDPAVVEERIHNMVALELKKVQTVANATKGLKGQSRKVQNAVASAIMHSRTRSEVEDNVNAALKANAVTGLSYQDIVDYEISNIWADVNPMLAEFHQSGQNKFYYNSDEIRYAHMWTKGTETEKIVDELAATGKTISTKYIVARQKLAQEDIDEAEQLGESAGLMAVIDKDNTCKLANSQLGAILVGDQAHSGADKVTTFESIGTKTTTDAFTTVKNPATANTVTLKDLRLLADAVKNPEGKKKVMVLTTAVLTGVAEFKYGTGSSIHYLSKEEVAAQIGVDEIWITDLVAALTGVHAVCLLPDGYWIRTKKAIDINWPEYEHNCLNFMKEINVGGAIHDLLSTAVLKEA